MNNKKLEKLERLKEDALAKFKCALSNAGEMLREWEEEDKEPLITEVETLAGVIAFDGGMLCGISDAIREIKK